MFIKEDSIKRLDIDVLNFGMLDVILVQLPCSSTARRRTFEIMITHTHFVLSALAKVIDAIATIESDSDLFICVDEPL